MTTRNLSPTAQLLRNSRLFSLPPVLPSPTSGLNSKTHSDSATLPYPTRQALATPASSLHHGDWGLKRPLPRNAATKASQPTIRVLEADTVEQVTDFQSANDHNRTLLKWQEMNVPMMYLRKRTRLTGDSTTEPGQSVFNTLMDNTSVERAALATSRANNARKSPIHAVRAERWKHQGPSVVEMTEGDFKAWLAHVVGEPGVKRRFHAWLRTRL
ncbi:MAG: hypothetical protein INR71_07025, partial [Terriglobus roseus]|nr:hypothetical protein [Terriglobus roseus]